MLRELVVDVHCYEDQCQARGREQDVDRDGLADEHGVIAPPQARAQAGDGHEAREQRQHDPDQRDVVAGDGGAGGDLVETARGVAA